MPDLDMFPRLRAWSKRVAGFDGMCHCRDGDICDCWNQGHLNIPAEPAQLFWSHLIAVCIDNVLGDGVPGLDAPAADQLRERMANGEEVPHVPRCVNCDSDEDGDFLYWPRRLGADFPPGPQAEPEEHILYAARGLDADPENEILRRGNAQAFEEYTCFCTEIAAWLEGIGREDVKDALCECITAEFAAWRAEPWGAILPEDPC